jgi:hypothetical protein
MHVARPGAEISRNRQKKAAMKEGRPPAPAIFRGVE